MSNLFVYTENQAWVVCVEKTNSFGDFTFQKKNDACCIEKNAIQVVCESGQSLTFEGYKFLYHNYEEDWYLYNQKDVETIGRNENCDLSINSVHISNVHVQILKKEDGIWIQDLGSRNGLYKNGKRISFATMNNQDMFLIADCILYYVHSYLIVNQKGKKVTFEVEERETVNPYPVYDLFPPRFEFIPIDLESPVIHDIPKKGKLFQAIGPALLILFSSGMATVLEQILNSESSIAPYRLISPLCMSLAFLFYGLFNRKSTYKEEIQSFKKQETLYENHLFQKEREANELLTSYEEFLREERIVYENLHTNKQDNFKILIGKTEQSVSIFNYAKQGYQYEENHLVKKRKDLIEKYNQPLTKHIFFKIGHKIWISEHVSENFLIDFVIQANQCKYSPKIIICHHMLHPESKIFANPLCQYMDLPLCIEENNADGRIYAFLEKNEEYILLTDTFSYIQKYRPQTFIYMNPQIVAFPFDYVVNQVIKMEDSEKKLRTTLWYEKNQNKNVLSYFKKEEKNQVNLSCCIGIDEENREVVLDFTEGVDGPHALVAGMTGSGKSEFLSTLLLSLVVKNSSQFFQYILVDFKGGAFGQAFYEFSHCAGMVTNLEKDNLSRLMLSLRCEIEKRQRKLQMAKERFPNMTSHVDSYNDCMEDAISHLFIIVDEFAQMKMKFPEYLENLKEYARIGRSLGIHLILATQKPMGVVDEQIWSNSTLKVCLKVNSEMDSKEMLHNEKGAYLKNAGEFIAQNLDGERKGKAFYLQEPFKEMSSWQEMDHVVPNTKEETLFTKISSTIEKGNQKWILLPALSKNMDYEPYQWAWMDIPEKQQQLPVFLNEGQSMLVLCQDEKVEMEFINTLFHIYGKSVYTLGLEPYGIFPLIKEEMGKHAGQVWIIKQENYEWVLKYTRKTELRIIVFVQSCSIKYHSTLSYFDYRLCLQYRELDDVRTFFDQFKIGHVPMLKMEKDCYYIVYPIIEEMYSFGLAYKEKNVYLGLDVMKQTPVYYQHTLPLIVCYVQKSKEKEVEELLISIKNVFPSLELGTDIFVVNVIKEQSFFTSLSYQEMQYDVNILWIGLGIQEYGYLLKRSIPYERDVDRIFYDGKEVKKILYDTH